MLMKLARAAALHSAWAFTSRSSTAHRRSRLAGSTLVEDDGRFRRSWKPFVVACLRGKVSLAEVELELVAHRAPVVDAHVERMTAEAMRIAPLASERFSGRAPADPRSGA